MRNSPVGITCCVAIRWERVKEPSLLGHMIHIGELTVPNGQVAPHEGQWDVRI